MHKLVELHHRAVATFSDAVVTLEHEDWDRQTPCEEWDVRALVHHLTYENLWTGPILEGKTIAEVGDQFEGDLLGDAPIPAWEASVAAARRAVRKDDTLAGMVHLSDGDHSADDYVSMLVTDYVIHAWDIARAVHGKERLDPDMVAFVADYLPPRAEEWRSAGLFGPAATVPSSADEQTRLLALTGRAP